jgi:flagellar hook-associated protein 2
MAYTSSASTASTAIRNQVYQLMANDRIPLQRLQNQKTDLASRQKQYQGLGSKLSSLLTLTRSFASSGSQNPLRAITVTGGDPAAFTVTTDGTAELGSHTIEVQEVARRHVIASVSTDSKSKADAVGAKGKNGSDGGLQFRITAGGTSQTYSVDVAAGATTGEVMAAIAQAVNSQNGSVTAAVVAEGNGRSRLTLQSAETGQDARITAVEDLEGTWMAELGLAGSEDEAGAPLSSTVQSAVDARVRVDGVDVVSPGNTVTNLLPGISVELHAVSASVSVRVEQDADSIVKQLQSFITEYNSAVDEVRSLTQAADENGDNRGLFTGDASVSRLRTALRSAVALPISTEGLLKDLSAIGLTTDRSGHLELGDEEKLRSAIDADPKGVQALWTGTEGVAGRLAKLLDGFGPTGASYTRQIRSWTVQSRQLDDRITRENARLLRREQALTEQLAQMQATVASLTSQQTYLSSLLASGEAVVSSF